MASGFVDPTKAGKYPVVLSDALLGKSNSKEVYTGLRYNHRPTENAPSLARLKPNVSSKSSYDLSYNDKGIYKFQGNRSTGDGQYVLIFDPKREVFVLHKLDSLFNMNLIRTPTNSDAESLRQEYPHIEGTNISTSGGNNNSSKMKAASKDTAKDKGSGMLTMPEPGPPPKKLAPPPKKREPELDEEDDDEEDDDDDDDILIEVPGDDGRNANHDFSPAFAPRRFSEFVHASEEEEDADGEDDDESMDHFKLPSPLNRQAVQQDNHKQATHQIMELDDVESEEDEEEEQPQQHQQHDQDEEDTADFGMDELEAELEAELEGEFGGGNQSESEMSEED